MESIEVIDVVLFFVMITYGIMASNWIECWEEYRMKIRLPVTLALMSPVIGISYYLFTVAGII
ncbi:hypothetical protein Aeh1ORF075c [Aeromonas phage Aeh1]|uniref:Uncharacterized protein n=1 Tax=Aeromonas phage Aeh1 TaxID=2880362 RepID=Q76Z11_9CAUD|nr:hypothetical protein Aeh1p080 [Aeromonas phage Aeh1]AAQ17735.1 hypothetical protein Aeh1ORF075c [Aeromonas phage Aeh1]